MKIIQLSDTHLPDGGEDTMGIDIHSNFNTVLEAVENEQPDHLIISGDLSFHAGSRRIYQLMKLKLDKLGIPYSLISGNHDDPEMLAEVFNLQHLVMDEQLVYKRKLGDRTALFLDTTKGFVSDSQLAWIDKEFSKLRGNAIVFMHHPPIFAGVPHLDNNYALQNISEVQKLFSTYPRMLSIFCGHYHVEKTLCLNNMVVHITPSTYFQIDWRVPYFRVDHSRPAYRIIELLNGGILRSNVVYL